MHSRKIASTQDTQRFTLANPVLQGKPTNVCLLLIVEFGYKRTTVVLRINPPNLDQNSSKRNLATTYGFLRPNHTKDTPNHICKLDRQTLDPPWIQWTTEK